jgi:hypothetical protein
LTGLIGRSNLRLNWAVSPDPLELGQFAMSAKMRKAWSRLQPTMLSVLLVFGGMGGPLVFAPESRSTEELQESIPASERSEEFASLGRFDHERQMKLEQRLLAITFEVPSSHLGHTQNSVILVPTGHRLANGLLAPLTC